VSFVAWGFKDIAVVAIAVDAVMGYAGYKRGETKPSTYNTWSRTGSICIALGDECTI
jgi:hypothetical protein